MTVSRRRFLRRSSVVGLAALAPLTSQGATAKKGAITSSVASQNELLAQLRSESFVEHFNTQFHVQVSALDLQHLQLVKVSKKERLPQGEIFDIVFIGQKEKQFEQGTYVVTHDRMGSFPLFLVPVGKDTKDAYYQAVFSRLFS